MSVVLPDFLLPTTQITAVMARLHLRRIQPSECLAETCLLIRLPHRAHSWAPA
jgi:hypothetical protein